VSRAVPTIADSSFTWNLVEDVHRLLEFHFMVNAFRAGTVVAVVAGVIGWFMVLRHQTFAGHTLSVVAFPGAAGATLAGVSALFGYFGFCVLAALAIALIPRAGAHGTSEESAVIGTVQAFALACGFLFVTLYGGLLGGVNSLLFGSFLGITDGQVLTLVAVGAAAVMLMAVMGRPLLFASLDPDVAAAHGVPVRPLAVLFLVVLGLAVAEASQITGALLVFALLVVPPATAQRLTARPLLGIAVSVTIGVAVTWLGLACSYFTDQPVGFFVTTFAFAAYLLAYAGQWLAGRRRMPPAAAGATG
jgi:zinc/manganese transport system permease protein